MSAKVRIGLILVLFSAAEIVLTLHLHEVDVQIYHQYAVAFLTPPRFRAWPQEYPGLAELLFVLPLAYPGSYRVAFALLTLLALTLLVVYGVRRSGDAWGVRLLWYLAVGSVGLLAQRYDIVAATVTYVGLDAARRGQWRRAWACLVIGVLLKGYPLVFWPLVAAAQRRERGRWPWLHLAAAVGAAAAGLALPDLTHPGAALNAWRYLAGRSIEFESGPATVLYWFFASRFTSGYGSVNLSAGPVDHLVALGMLGVGLGVVGLAAWQVLRGRWPLMQAATLALGAVLLTSKVFSAQYLIWLAPLAAEAPLNLTLTLALGLSTLVYPLAFVFRPLQPYLMDLVTLRNLVLAAALVSLAWPVHPSVLGLRGVGEALGRPRWERGREV